MSTQDDDDDSGAARSTDPDTSHDAAASIKVSKIVRKISHHLFGMALFGATTTELSRDLDIILGSISPRMCKMEEKGMIVRTNTKRKSLISKCDQRVWIRKEFAYALDSQGCLPTHQEGIHPASPTNVEQRS